MVKAWGTIEDDDSPRFVIDDVTRVEGNSGTTAFIFTVTRLGNTSQTAMVDFETAAGTATADVDYQGITNGHLVFDDPLQTEKTITVAVNRPPHDPRTLRRQRGSKIVVASRDPICKSCDEGVRRG